MVVDDSAVIRGFIKRYLMDDPMIDVVATASDGLMALTLMKSQDIEAIVLDIEMPRMDGLTALPKLIEMNPDVAIVMASTLTLKSAEVSLTALQKGAVDYVPKPESARNMHASNEFRTELLSKVKAWATRRRKKRGVPLPSGIGAESRSGITKPAKPAGNAAAEPDRAPVKKRSPVIISSDAIKFKPLKIVKPKILAIASSTGGPQALLKFFTEFKQRPKVPIVITQHMPAHFTAILAQHINQHTGWDASEAADGMVLESGKVYVAPGDYHLTFEKDGQKIICRLDQNPPENFCRPSADPMFRSLGKLFSDKVLCVILTGMGYDGLEGARDLSAMGANVMAQDEATSVVWGMPGAVASAGICAKVLPLSELGDVTFQQQSGGAF